MLATIVCASEQEYLKNIKTKTISLCILSITITIYKKSQKLAWISIATNILFKRPYIKSIAYVLDSECHAKAFFYNTNFLRFMHKFTILKLQRIAVNYTVLGLLRTVALQYFNSNPKIMSYKSSAMKECITFPHISP